MGLRGSFAMLEFDKQAYSRYFDAKMQELTKNCVRTWLAVAVSKIPTYSGMSRGTLLKLAEKVGFPIAIFPIAQEGKNKGFPADAREVGREASQGGLLTKFPRYGMYYSHNVTRLRINNKYDARQWGYHLKTPGPYEFVAAANAAFKKNATALLRRFRYDIKRFMKTHVKEF